MSTSYKGYELNSETIEEILQETEKYCSQLNTEQRQILRVRLTLDELILTLMEHYGNGASVSIVSGKYRGCGNPRDSTGLIWTLAPRKRLELY